MKKYIVSERASLFEPNIYISMIVKLTGDIEKEQIIDAVNAAYHANEACMSKIVLTSSGEAYYDKVPETMCRIFVKQGSIKEIISKSEKIPFKINKGEMIRSYILPDENGITLLIMAHHLVGDGKSILIFINDIISYLSGKSLKYKPLQTISKDALLQKSQLPLPVKLLVNLANKRWTKTGKVFSWNDYNTIHEEYWNSHKTSFHIKTYNSQELKNMISEAKKHNVTLNSYLIALLQKEYNNLSLIGIPVSIRENNNSMSNQTSGIRIKYKYNKSKTIAENTININKKIYKLLKCDTKKYFALSFIAQLLPSLKDAVLMKTHGCYANVQAKEMCTIMGYEGKTKTQLGVTNLTRINITADYEKFKIENILFIPPRVSYSDIVVGICTFNEKLNIIISD